MPALHAILLCCALAACALAACAPAPPAPAPEEDTVKYEASTVAELKAPLFNALHAAAAAGTASFELVLAPGVYEGRDLSLEDWVRPPGLAITVRGAGPGPTVLRDARLKVLARDVRIENLIVEGYHGDVPVIEVHMVRALHIQGLQLVGTETSGAQHSGAAPLHIVTLPGDDLRTVRIADSWFSGNRVAAPGTLIRLDAVLPRPIAQLVFADTGFAGNHTTTLVHGLAVDEARLSGLAVAEPEAGALWWSSYPQGRVSVEGCTIALGAGEGWLSRLANPPGPADIFPAPTVANSTLLVPGVAPVDPGALQALAALATASPMPLDELRRRLLALPASPQQAP